jgi:hypothetical protein
MRRAAALAALSPERVMVVDPRTGKTTERELPGGTLCHGPVLAVGGRIVYSGTRESRLVALSAPLSRPGVARSLGRADTIFGLVGARAGMARPLDAAG